MKITDSNTVSTYEQNDCIEQFIYGAFWNCEKLVLLDQIIEQKLNNSKNVDSLTSKMKELVVDKLNKSDLDLLTLHNLQLNEDSVPEQLTPWIKGSEDIELFNLFLNEAYTAAELSTHLEFIGYACLLYKLYVVARDYKGENITFLVTMFCCSDFNIIKSFFMKVIIDIFVNSYCGLNHLIEMQLLSSDKNGNIHTNLESNHLFQIFFKKSDKSYCRLHCSYFLSKLIEYDNFDNYNLYRNSEYVKKMFATLWKKIHLKSENDESYADIIKRYGYKRDALGYTYYDYNKMNFCE